MSEKTAKELRAALAAALYRVFSALARVCLRRGVPFDAVADIAKQAFVDVAERDFAIAGRKVSASRIALLTGIHRKEIARMKAAARPGDAAAVERVSHSAGIIGGWRRDSHYLDSRGQPAALAFEGDERSFTSLVRRYGGGDVPPRAALDELVRVDAAERTRGGKIRLLASAYVPSATSPGSLTILGTDVGDLIAAIDHNLSCPPGEGFFQRKVAYDNLPLEALEGILARIERDGTGLIEKLDRAISKHDRDSNPKAKGSGRKRAMVGVYCFAEDEPEED